MQQTTSTPNRSRAQTSLIGAAMIAAMALAGACSSGPELEASVDTMIEFEATWQCDVGRFAYDSVDEIDERRERVRDRFGVTEQDHKIFTDMVQGDEELRDAVSLRNDELCPVVEN